MDIRKGRIIDKEKDVKIEKKVKKSDRKKINVDFGDDKDDSLF